MNLASNNHNLENLSKEEILKLLMDSQSQLMDAQFKIKKYEDIEKQLQKKDAEIEELKKKNALMSGDMRAIREFVVENTKLIIEAAKELNKHVIILDDFKSKTLLEQLKEIFKNHLAWINTSVTYFRLTDFGKKGPDVKGPKVKSEINESIELVSTSLQANVAKMRKFSKIYKNAMRQLDKEDRLGKVGEIAKDIELINPIVVKSPNKESQGRKKIERKFEEKKATAKDNFCPNDKEKEIPIGEVWENVLEEKNILEEKLNAIKNIYNVTVCMKCGHVSIIANEEQDVAVVPGREITVDTTITFCDLITHGIPTHRFAVRINKEQSLGNDTLYYSVNDYIDIYLKPLYQMILNSAKKAKEIVCDETVFPCLESIGQNTIRKRDKNNTNKEKDVLVEGVTELVGFDGTDGLEGLDEVSSLAELTDFVKGIKLNGIEGIDEAEDIDFIEEVINDFDSINDNSGSSTNNGNKEKQTRKTNYILAISSVPHADVPFVMYSYINSRSTDAIRNVVSDDFEFDTLICDGYQGYSQIVAEHSESKMQRCLVHFRRAIIKAHNPTAYYKDLDKLPEEELIKWLKEDIANGSPAFILREVYIAISKIYEVEDSVDYSKDNWPSELLKQRKLHSSVLMSKIDELMSILSVGRIKKNKTKTKWEAIDKNDRFAAACVYYANQKNELITFLHDPMVPPDSNIVEGKIRPLTVLRRSCDWKRSEDYMQNLCVLLSVWNTLSKYFDNDDIEVRRWLRNYSRALHLHCITNKVYQWLKDGNEPKDGKIGIKYWNMKELSSGFDFARWDPTKLIPLK